MTRDEFYQGIVDMSDGEKVKMAHNAMLAILQALKGADYSDEDAINFLVSLTASFVGADNLVSAKEFALFKAITEVPWDYDQFFQIMGNYDRAAGNRALDELLDKVGGDFKTACLSYGMAFLAIDDKLSGNEVDLFERFWAD